MNSEREQELRECIGVWAEGGRDTAKEALDGVKHWRERAERAEAEVERLRTCIVDGIDP